MPSRSDAPPRARPTIDSEHGYFALRDEEYSVDARSAELMSLTDSRVHAVGAGSAQAATVLDSIVDSIRSEAIDVGAFGPLMQALARNRGLVQALATLDSFDELIYSVTLSRRRRALELLRTVAADPASTADTMWPLLNEEWWIFGSQLVPMPSAWDIPGLPERCLPLIRFDRAVHLVLVESPNVAVVGAVEENYPVSQLVYTTFDRARDLIGVLQDNRRDIEDRLRFMSNRVSVSVLIGYPNGIDPPLHVVREKLRGFNSYVTSFNVVTYEELLTLAESMLPPADERGRQFG